MLEIKGKYGHALVYASIIEQEAIDQIQRMCDQIFTQNSTIRIMSDVHAGKGCTIGTTMTITDKVVPNIVGVDIGCGMYVINVGKEPIDLKALDQAAHDIPSGFNVWNDVQEEFDLSQLRCFDQLKNLEHLKRSLGTLGGGNHFIEVNISQDGTQYLVIHSGSRNLGVQVASIYQKKAIALHNEYAYELKRKDLIQQYKEEGRILEINDALASLKQDIIPDDLCYLYGKDLEDYLHDMKITQAFAKRNREVIGEVLLKKVNLTNYSSFHTIHNYIDLDYMILRKGSIRALKDEIVLIPINMKDGSILAKGKGNKDWNNSAPHGAGRLMSRKQAKQLLSLEEYKESMKDIYTTSVNKDTLDEAPMAYKAINQIIEDIEDTVEIIEVIKPIYNFKASGE